MKIAVACSGLGHVARGVEAWAADLGRTLFERGYSVVLCKGGGTVEAPYQRVLPCLQRMAARTQYLAKWTKRGFWRLYLGSAYQLEEATFTWHLLKLLRRETIDILHVQDPHIALFVQHANRLGWVPTRTVYGNTTNEPMEFLRKISYLHHVAPYHLETAREAGVWRPTWTLIPNFIDTDLFHPGRCDALRAELGIPTDAFVVLTAAAIKRDHKRVDHLIEEFSRLLNAHPDLPAWLVVAGGREPETDEVIQRGREILGDRVRFLVQFPRQRMPELYRAANLFVLCSLREMFGVVLLEAAASGLPILVHDEPVLRWVVGPGCEHVDMTQPGAVARALRTWVDDGARRQERGALARQYCQEHFSRDKVIDQILQYYRFVLSHDRPQAMVRNETMEASSELTCR